MSDTLNFDDYHFGTQYIPFTYRWNCNDSKQQPGTPVPRTHCCISYTDRSVSLPFNVPKYQKSKFFDV